MKKFVAGFLLGSLVFGTTAFAAGNTLKNVFADQHAKFLVNNQQLKLDQDPIMYNDHFYVPVATLARQLGYQVDYDGSTDTVTMTNQSSTETTSSANTSSTSTQPLTGDAFNAKVMDAPSVPLKPLAPGEAPHVNQLTQAEKLAVMDMDACLQGMLQQIDFNKTDSNADKIKALNKSYMQLVQPNYHTLIDPGRTDLQWVAHTTLETYVSGVQYLNDPTDDNYMAWSKEEERRELAVSVIFGK